MSSKINIKISTPTDEDGYILLKNPGCGEYFVIEADEI